MHEPARPTSLRRLGPWIRPIAGRMVLGGLTALGASVFALAIPQVLRGLVNTALGPDASASGLWRGAAIVLALGVLEAGFIALRRVFVLAPATVVERDMRTSFYRKLQRLPVAFHDQWSSGQLLSRAVSDLNFLRRWMAFGVIMLVVTTLTVIIGLTLMFTTAWQLAIVFVLAAVPTVLGGFRFRKDFSVVSRRSQDQAGDLATTVEESVHGIRVLKAFGRSEEALEDFESQAAGLQATEISKAKILAVFSMIVALLPELATAISLVLGVFLAADGQLSIGALVAFFATATVVAGPVEALGPLLSMTLSARTAADRVLEVFESTESVADPERPTAPPRTGALRLADVHFRYPDAAPESRDLIDGVDLDLVPGETLALVGVTGSGKSTLIQLIPRLYDVTGGAVLVDGQDVRDYSQQELRARVAIAFEDTTLFSTSVRENVLLGSPAQGADRARQDAALERALDVAAAGFAHRLAEGVETRIGEEGLSLSGGQRQRIALARAIAAEPEILVLDDPLSALDVATEARVTQRLREELAGTTTVVVAHRPSTVALADRVALLREGRIAALGTHAELLATDADYRYVIASLESDWADAVGTAREDEDEDEQVHR